MFQLNFQRLKILHFGNHMDFLEIVTHFVSLRGHRLIVRYAALWRIISDGSPSMRTLNLSIEII